jgi:hypothetical protein
MVPPKKLGFPLWVDPVEKGFEAGSPTNIDSRRPLNAQGRFKKSSPGIRLLRAGAVPPTFSTASVRSRKARLSSTAAERIPY